MDLNDFGRYRRMALWSRVSHVENSFHRMSISFAGALCGRRIGCYSQFCDSVEIIETNYNMIICYHTRAKAELQLTSFSL